MTIGTGFMAGEDNDRHATPRPRGALVVRERSRQDPDRESHDAAALSRRRLREPGAQTEDRLDPIPFGAKRKAETVAYARRHYGSFMKPTWRLRDPHVIVIHYTEASYSSTLNTFATDVPDSELHELPATSAHFVIDTDGTIHQLVSLGTMARHTVGLNWTAIGIEHVGFSDAQVLGDRRQITASLQLVQWLRCRYGIAVKNVIGHNESLSSPYHHEDVPALRTQTHSDFDHADMNIYRRACARSAAAPHRDLARCGGWLISLVWQWRCWLRPRRHWRFYGAIAVNPQTGAYGGS